VIKKHLTIITSILLIITSCSSSKSSLKINLIDTEKEGYTLGIIEPKGGGNCGWMISDIANKKYDPINIEHEKFLRFSLKKEKIYFKFLPLRMKNRCENISPIQLIEIVSYTK
jgi:hypothetical protein